MYAVELAAIACVPLAAGLIRDWRDASNAILAGLALSLTAFGAIEWLLPRASAPARLALVAVALLVASGPLLICAYLLHNALARTLREPAPLARVPALLAASAILALFVVAVVTQRTGSAQLSIAATVVTLLFGYVSALLALFVLASWLMRLAGPAPDGDFVVVLGSGLGPGGQVPPLLAARLDRGVAVFSSLAASGRDPVLIVSGGKGSTEQVSEAEAMAGYLTQHGFPAGSVRREDQSGTTEQNLANSAALMDRLRPGSSCVIVTSDFHALRTALLAGRLGLDARVAGARAERRAERPRWPNAMVREFGAAFLSSRMNAAICLLTVALPVAYLALRG